MAVGFRVFFFVVVVCRQGWRFLMALVASIEGSRVFDRGKLVAPPPLRLCQVKTGALRKWLN